VPPDPEGVLLRRWPGAGINFGTTYSRVAESEREFEFPHFLLIIGGGALQIELNLSRPLIQIVSQVDLMLKVSDITQLSYR
jgi:hypothetical protein